MQCEVVGMLHSDSFCNSRTVVVVVVVVVVVTVVVVTVVEVDYSLQVMAYEDRMALMRHVARMTI